MARAHHFIVVGERIREEIGDTLAPFGTVSYAPSVARALTMLVEGRMTLTGALVQIDLPDGTGYDVVERGLFLEVDIPTVLVSLGLERWNDWSMRAFALECQCLPSPLTPERVALCVRRWDRNADEDEASDERFIVSCAKERGVGEDEVRANVEGIKRKTWSRTLAAATRRLCKEVRLAAQATDGCIELPKAQH